MHSSKLLEVFQVLEKTEIKQLGRFLQIPSFIQIKQRNKALLLLEYLLKYHRQEGIRALDKEVVFQHVFPGESYTSNKIDKLMARLLKAAKKFIVYTHSTLEHDGEEQLLVLARFYRSRELEKQFQQCMAQLQRRQTDPHHQDADFYYRRYLIEREVTHYASLYNKRRDDLNLPQTLQSLDAFYLIAKLEYACWSLAQRISAPLEVENSLSLLDLLLPRIATDYAPHYPLLRLYYEAYRLLRYDDVSDGAQVLQEQLTLLGPQVPLEQLQALQAIYRSYIIREYNLGEQESPQEIYELYRRHLEAGYLYRQGGIHPGMLRNIVTFGLKAQAFDWVFDLLQSHQHKIIGTKHPEEVYRFNLASYYFARQDYAATLQNLGGYEEDTYYKIAAKRLELQVYFETQSDLLEPKMTAFKVFIYRVSKKVLPAEPFKRNNNFITLLRQINSPQVFKNQRKIDKLIEKIRTLGAVAEREWLLEKLLRMQ